MDEPRTLRTMSAATSPSKATGYPLRIVDALEHPHGGWIIRLRVASGAPPALGDLRKSGLTVEVADGTSGHLTVQGFPVMGGAASDHRVRETGRVDIHGVWSGSPPGAPLIPGGGARVGRS